VEDEEIVDLQVSAEGGIKSIAKYQLCSSSFLGENENSTWRSFTIDFTVKTPLEQVEFRELEPSLGYDIYLAFILLEKTG